MNSWSEVLPPENAAPVVQPVVGTTASASCRKERDPVKASRHLVASALEEVCHGKNLSMWLRGLTPIAATRVDDPKPVQWMQVGDTSRIRNCTQMRTVFLDGSGTTSDTRLRRCGWGVAWLTGDSFNRQAPRLEGGIFGSLGSERHTVAKAELEALLRALEFLGDNKQVLKIWSDNKYVVDMYHRVIECGGPSRIPGLKAHGDRWARLWKLVAGRSDRIDLCWVKAHVTAELQVKM